MVGEAPALQLALRWLGGTHAATAPAARFRPGSGTDYVVDFTPGGTEDAIEIGYSSIDTFSELLDATSNTNDGCVISIDETTTVHLLGVSKDQLTAADFYVPLYNDIGLLGS